MSDNAPILVTGGAGYIGSHIVAELLSSGTPVVVLDNLSRGHREAVERAERIAGRKATLEVADLCDTEAVQRILQKHAPHVVIHVAAYKSVAESVAHPELYERNNVDATRSLAGAMARTGIRRVVYASTGSVYGDRASEAYAEVDPTAPINPYAATKLGGEEALAAFAAQIGGQVAFMRFFNVVGAHPSGELGEFGDTSTNLLPILLDLLADRRESLTVFGTDWDTPDGTCIRDYVHVCDVAAAMVAAARQIDSIDSPRVFNVGTGLGTSVRELLTAVEQAAGKPLRAVDGPRREGDPGVSVASVSRIASELGWTAERNLSEMVRSALVWDERRSASLA